MKPYLFLLIGPSGSGKTTFANNVLRGHLSNHVYLNADSMRGVISGDEGNQSVSTEAFSKLGDVAKYHAYLGDNIIVDNLNLSYRARSQWLSICGEKYNKVAIVFSGLNLETCLDRVASRKAATGRDVPRHIIEGQFKPYNNIVFDDNSPLKDEDIDEIIYLSPSETNVAAFSMIMGNHDKE
jgi:protein phosphatase